MIRVIFFVIVSLVLTQASADPLAWSRINDLPPAEQTAWKVYLDRSQAKARADAAALQAEVVAQKMTNALRAPSGGDFKLSAPAGAAWYASAQARQLTDVVLSYQTPSGGWSKHTGYSAGPRQPGMQWTSQNEPGQAPHYVATFDNRSTTEQLHFLAYGWHATRREDCRTAFIKGLNYIFAAQYPNGGWPQGYPLEGDYHDHITFNDDAMTHVLELLYAIKSGEPYYAFLDDALRQKAATAFDLGIQCVLQMQFVQAGKKTAWGGQHDPLTLQPASARKMEPATLSGLESAQLLKFLMTITNPAPEVVTSIAAGLAWLEDVKITNISKTTLNGKTVYVTDPDSTQTYWARFYHLANSKPVFPGRDGNLYDTFAAMAANNKVGYDFYTTLPRSIVTNGQKKWRKMLADAAKP